MGVPAPSAPPPPERGGSWEGGRGAERHWCGGVRRQGPPPAPHTGGMGTGGGTHVPRDIDQSRGKRPHPHGAQLARSHSHGTRPHPHAIDSHPCPHPCGSRPHAAPQGTPRTPRGRIPKPPCPHILTPLPPGRAQHPQGPTDVQAASASTSPMSHCNHPQLLQHPGANPLTWVPPCLALTKTEPPGTGGSITGDGNMEETAGAAAAPGLGANRLVTGLGTAPPLPQVWGPDNPPYAGVGCSPELFTASPMTQGNTWGSYQLPQSQLPPRAWVQGGAGQRPWGSM